jgi:hypothetical protein
MATEWPTQARYVTVADHYRLPPLAARLLLWRPGQVTAPLYPWRSNNNERLQHNCVVEKGPTCRWYDEGKHNAKP